MSSKRNAFARVPAAVSLLIFLGCASLQTPLEVPPGPGTEKEISLKASSFEFRPNHILAKAGDTLVLKVENASSMGHNLTVEAPDGAVLVSVDLPSGQVIPVKVPLARAGVYGFYCDKPLHPTLGMKGKIEAR